MQVWHTIFLLSCLIIFYNYAGYAILILPFNTFRNSAKRRHTGNGFYPTVSFIVAAFNEEDFIQKKINNSLEQNYPADKIEFIFVTDGSTDNTVALLRQHPSIQLLHAPERRGKSAAINKAVQFAKNEILIFSDANTNLNQDATLNIARHYEAPSTGGVSGEKKIISLAGSAGQVSAGEGLYWKYESLLKKIDSDFYSVVGAAGELFSVRKELYQPLPADVILDDFVISLKTAQKGYRIIYEPEAYAMELPSFSLQDEQKRKVRIAAGGFQAIALLSSLFKFWKHPRLSFLYISHRVLRWTVSPVCLLLAFISNLVLFFSADNILLNIFFIGQICFYLMAAIAGLFPSASQIKALKIPYYFTFMNLSVFMGFFRFLRGSQSAIWEKAKRAQPSLHKS